MSDHALEQCVDQELADRSGVEIACAYRALCAAILIRTAMVAGAKVPPRKQEIDQKRTAIGWVAGDHGLITFSDACEAVGLEPDGARESIRRYASGGGKESISTGEIRRPRSRSLFHRKPRNAAPDVHFRKAPAPHGVDACTADAASDRGQPAWA